MSPGPAVHRLGRGGGARASPLKACKSGNLFPNHIHVRPKNSSRTGQCPAMVFSPCSGWSPLR
eukprot:5224190-Prorocentrum_lima.AAC.1